MNKRIFAHSVTAAFCLLGLACFGFSASAAVSCSAKGNGKCTTHRFAATDDHYVRIHINADRPGTYRLYDDDTGKVVASGRYGKGRPAVRRTVRGLYGHYRLTLTGQKSAASPTVRPVSTKNSASCRCTPMQQQAARAANRPAVSADHRKIF